MSKVNINAASKQDLIEKLGLNETIAGRVIRVRDGAPFSSLEDLVDNVEGLGAITAEQIAELVEYGTTGSTKVHQSDIDDEQGTSNAVLKGERNSPPEGQVISTEAADAVKTPCLDLDWANQEIIASTGLDMRKLVEQVAIHYLANPSKLPELEERYGAIGSLAAKVRIELGRVSENEASEAASMNFDRYVVSAYRDRDRGSEILEQAKRAAGLVGTQLRARQDLAQEFPAQFAAYPPRQASTQPTQPSDPDEGFEKWPPFYLRLSIPRIHCIDDTFGLGADDFLMVGCSFWNEKFPRGTPELFTAMDEGEYYPRDKTWDVSHRTVRIPPGRVSRLRHTYLILEYDRSILEILRDLGRQIAHAANTVTDALVDLINEIPGIDIQNGLRIDVQDRIRANLQDRVRDLTTVPDKEDFFLPNPLRTSVVVAWLSPNAPPVWRPYVPGSPPLSFRRGNGKVLSNWIHLREQGKFAEGHYRLFFKYEMFQAV